MRSIATPRVMLFALCFAAASPAWAGTAAARGAAPEGGTGLLTVDSIQFNQLRDSNNNNPWMQVSIDVTARNNPAATTTDARRWLPNVSFTFTVGWGSRGGSGQQAQLEAAASVTAQALALEVGSRTTILFFIAPEFIKMNGITAGSPPTFYALQISAGGTSIKVDPRTMASSNLTGEASVEGFLNAANQKLNESRGAMMAGYDLPPVLYVSVLTRGNIQIPTYIRGSSR